MYNLRGFCKTVIRFVAINAWRDRSRRRQKDIICGQTVTLTNGELAAALLSLPEKRLGLSILVYKYYLFAAASDWIAGIWRHLWGRTGQIVAIGVMGYYGFTTNEELKIENVENGDKKDKQEIIML